MDNTLSREVLKVTYRPVKESAIDTINAFIKLGVVSKPETK